MDEALNEIQRIAAQFVWRQAVLPDSRLWHDLRIGGDDAWELLDEVVGRFQTSFETMTFSAYFPDETEAWRAGIGMMLGFRSDKKAVTVHHLAEVVKLGAWFDPPSG